MLSDRCRYNSPGLSRLRRLIQGYRWIQYIHVYPYFWAEVLRLRWPFCDRCFDVCNGLSWSLALYSSWQRATLSSLWEARIHERSCKLWNRCIQAHSPLGYKSAARLIRLHQEEKVDGSCVKSNSYQLIINLAGAFVGGGLNECNHVPLGDGTMMNYETWRNLLIQHPVRSCCDKLYSRGKIDSISPSLIVRQCLCHAL